jgi:mannose-6-phosphate isomerase-like protein (cupin superfamily)
MGETIYEFMTHWDDSRRIWFKRDEDELIGTQRSGGRAMPRIRIFDLLHGPTNRPGFKPPVVWKGEDAVIEAHNPDGAEPVFHRPADYDVLFFQFSGRATAETEYGEFHLAPGHSMHIPAGVAYRMAGNPECRQMVVKVHTPVKVTLDPNNPLAETVFDVRAVGALPKDQPVQMPERKGKILEVTEFWDDRLEPIVIERDHAKLVGCVTFERGRGREVSVLRVFDYFVGMTGKGAGPGPQQYESRDFRTDTYNTEGQQAGFHRGMDDDEIWFQFRAHGVNETEWGIHELDPGEMGYVPRGIAHRITGGPGFLRYVLYFRHPMYPQVEAGSHRGHTTFEVNTVSYKELPALAEAKAKAESEGPRQGRQRQTA